MTVNRWDMIVIGAGPGGYVAAIRAAQLGLKVALIEREHLGGICLNWGCIPTKAMLRSAEVLALIRHADSFGLSASDVGYDLARIVDRARAVSRQLTSGIGYLMKKNGVSVIVGNARLAGKGLVNVSSDNREALHESGTIVLATGARARELPGLEADGKRVWNYRHALQPPHQPKRLLVVGSGAIGVEFASFYTALGAKTTIIEVQDRILPLEDHEISACAATALEKQGMRICPGTTVAALERGELEINVTLVAGGRTTVEGFDTVISAVGITGNVENIGLEQAGVAVERGHVAVDPRCRTSAKGIYAIGDLAGPPWLAHKAAHEGVMVAELAAGKTPHPVDATHIPGCIYCMPQIASVGLTESRAKEAGYALQIGRSPFVGNGKAVALGETAGFVKTVFDANTGELLGAHMIGPEVTELIHGYAIGRVLEATQAEFEATVFPHPTLSESMHEAVLAAAGKAIHS